MERGKKAKKLEDLLRERLNELGYKVDLPHISYTDEDPTFKITDYLYGAIKVYDNGEGVIVLFGLDKGIKSVIKTKGFKEKTDYGIYTLEAELSKRVIELFPYHEGGCLVQNITYKKCEKVDGIEKITEHKKKIKILPDINKKGFFLIDVPDPVGYPEKEYGLSSRVGYSILNYKKNHQTVLIVDEKHIANALSESEQSFVLVSSHFYKDEIRNLSVDLEKVMREYPDHKFISNVNYSDEAKENIKRYFNSKGILNFFFKENDKVNPKYYMPLGKDEKYYYFEETFSGKYLSIEHKELNCDKLNITFGSEYIASQFSFYNHPYVKGRFVADAYKNALAQTGHMFSERVSNNYTSIIKELDKYRGVFNKENLYDLIISLRKILGDGAYFFITSMVITNFISYFYIRGHIGYVYQDLIQRDFILHMIKNFLKPFNTTYISSMKKINTSKIINPCVQLITDFTEQKVEKYEQDILDATGTLVIGAKDRSAFSSLVFSKYFIIEPNQNKCKRGAVKECLSHDLGEISTELCGYFSERITKIREGTFPDSLKLDKRYHSDFNELYIYTQSLFYSIYEDMDMGRKIKKYFEIYVLNDSYGDDTKKDLIKHILGFPFDGYNTASHILSLEGKTDGEKKLQFQLKERGIFYDDGFIYCEVGSIILNTIFQDHPIRKDLLKERFKTVKKTNRFGQEHDYIKYKCFAKILIPDILK